MQLRKTIKFNSKDSLNYLSSKYSEQLQMNTSTDEKNCICEVLICLMWFFNVCCLYVHKDYTVKTNWQKKIVTKTVI